ncbi:MAG: DegV family protein [bacterium]|nr:DegV family protein [bacterium]
MKVAIVTDSNSGVTQQEGKDLGLFILPMPFMINETTFFEGITLSQEEFYNKLADNTDVLTSQPTPDSIMTLWDEILEEYDQIVHIPMSSGLSGSCQTAKMLAEDYDGKVEVVNDHRVSLTQLQSALNAKQLAEQGKTAKEIRECLEADKYESSIYITVNTLKYLKKGGRITATAAAVGTVLSIKPVLTIQGEKLDSFAKARSMKSAKKLMISAIQKDLEERFHDPECNNMSLGVAYTEDREQAEGFKKELQEIWPNADIVIYPLGLSVACHIGPGSLAVACAKKVN